MRRALALAVVCLLACAASAHAVQLRTPDGQVAQPFQRWANRALVPTVPAAVVLDLGGCPWAPTRSGCLELSDPFVIHLFDYWDRRRAFLHELGHVYDRVVLDDAERLRFLRIVGAADRAWFWADYTRPAPDRDAPGEELFAEAYSLCARRLFIGRFGDRRQDIIAYGYEPDGRMHRRACAMIRATAVP